MVRNYDFLFFKQETADEMRISDWSSDVCSSDLQALAHQANAFGLQTELMQPRNAAGGELTLYQPADVPLDKWTAVVALFHDHAWESGVLPWALASEAFYVGAQGEIGRAHV